MIGQKRLLGELNSLICNETLPRFIIVTGDRGSESDEIAPYIAGTMQASYIRLSDVKVDTIRKMIAEAYDFIDTVIYNIVGADNMSINAKNALLKVCEEPPNNAYFVMTLDSVDNMLGTIKSRATIFTMDKYSKKELRKYCDSKYSGNMYNDMILSFADTPGEIDILHAMDDVGEFYHYTEHFLDNVPTASGSDALGMTSEVSVKDNDGKYDILMFFKLFQNLCISKAGQYSDSKTISHYCWSVICASKCMGDIRRIKGVNKQMLLDDFVLQLRKIWK